MKKKLTAHHVLTANGGRIASRVWVRPYQRFVSTTTPHGYPIPLIVRGRLIALVTGKEKMDTKFNRGHCARAF